MDPPLALERFAELSAEIDAGVPRDQVLASAGVPLETWLVVQQGWLGRMGVEANQRRFETSKRFQKIFLAHRRELAKRGVGRVFTKAPSREMLIADSLRQPQSGPVSGSAPMSAPPSQREAVAVPLAAGYGASARGTGPRLTLPQFASFCVEIAVYPHALPDVHGRYGFDVASAERENQEWQWRFSEDRSLYDQFSLLFTRYRDWLLGGGRR